MTTNQMPQMTKTYQNHILDGTRWRHYQPRVGDVIVTTSYKSRHNVDAAYLCCN